MKIKKYKQWLTDENNNILSMPLSFLFDYFGIIEAEKWYWFSKKEFRYMSIFKKGGYGLKHEEYETYKNKLFFVGNVDLDVPKLVEK